MEAFLHCVPQYHDITDNDITYKLKSTMYLLLDPNAKVNQNYLNQLLKILTDDADSLDSCRLEEDFFINWFKSAVETWSSSIIHIPRNVLIFTVNLASSFVKKEKFFTKLNCTRILEKFIGIVRAVPEPIQFSLIKISYTKLLLSILQHDSGLDWLMQTNYWFDLITIASQGSQGELEKKSLAVLLHLLEYSNRYSEVFFKKVVKTILTPLEDLAVSALNDNDTSLLEINSCRLEEDFFINWFKSAVETWSSSIIHIPRNVLIFTVNLASSFVKKEKFFTKLNCTRILEKFIGIVRAVPEPIQFSLIKISYTKLLLSILQHDSGLDWLMQTNYWFDLITIASQGSQGELEKKSLAVLLHLLEYSNRYSEVFFKKVVKTILTPLEDLAVSALNDNDTSLLEISEMKETLDFVKNILTNILKRSSESRMFSVLSNFVEENNLDKKLSDIISVVDNKNSLVLLSNILSLVLFCQLSISFRKQLPLKYAAVIKKIDNLIIDVLNKCKPYNTFFTIIECGFMLGNYIFEVHTNMHDSQMVEDIETFQNQLLIYLIMPLFDTATKLNKGRKEIIENEDFRQKFFSKIFKIAQPATFKTVVRLKPFYNNVTIEDSTKALEYVHKCLPSIQHNVANTITQMLIYNFSDMLSTMTTTQIIHIWTQDLIGLYIDTLVLLLKTFDLTWKDSVETVYVTDIAMHFLDQPCWAPKLVAKGLELLDVAVSKCLSPNMALLLNKETDSQIRDLEDIIVKHTRSQCWEIRCMALQIIGTVARMAKNNFDAYQRMLIKARLPRLVMNIALNDANCQVKVKGLQCLQEIIKVEELWSYLIRSKNIHDQLLKYFYLQQEGIVRSEALVLLKVIFEEQKLPEIFEEKIYDCMIFAILQDEHKLVKLKALSFWDLVIKKELEHEGMIDGFFPSVTFSKVLKKIITFDDSTMEGCLLRVLFRLSTIGGLYAFIHIFENENDDELFSPDIVYIHKFVELLIKHNITSSIYMNTENDCYPSSDNNLFEETESNFISELLDLETNRILRYPKQGLSSAKKNNQMGFWGFIRALDHFCNKRAKKDGISEDLATVLSNIFTD